MENEVMEPLVNYLDRLEPSLSRNSQSGFSQSGFRPVVSARVALARGSIMITSDVRVRVIQNCVILQLILDFFRHGTFNDSAIRDNLIKAQILSSKLK